MDIAKLVDIYLKKEELKLIAELCGMIACDMVCKDSKTLAEHLKTKVDKRLRHTRMTTTEIYI